MKKFQSLLFLCLWVLFATACSGQTTPTPTIPPLDIPSEPEITHTPLTSPTAEKPPTPTTTTAPTPTPVPEVTPVNEADIVDILWLWTDISAGQPVTQTLVPNPEKYSMVLRSDGLVNIQADCNSVGGTYTLDGRTLTITLGPSTKAYCGDASLDQTFLEALGMVNQVGLEDGRLQLYLADNDGLMNWQNGGSALEETTVTPTVEPDTVTAVTPQATAIITAEDVLLDKVWQWTSFTSPQDGPQEIAEPERYQIRLGSNGRVFIQADCNTGGGVYSLDETTLSIVPGPLTAAACPEESQAEEFLQYLSAAALWFMDGDDLLFDLKFDSGTMRFQAAPDSALAESAAANSSSAPADEGQNIQLNVQGVAQSYAWQVQEGEPFSADSGGTAIPAHILVTFDGEDPQEVLANNGRRLYIFPVQGYRNVAGDAAAVEIDRLEALMAEANGRVDTPDNPMPFLPSPLGFMDRWVQFTDLNFTQGMGVRYVSDSPNRQAIGPWTNETTAYYYQGLSQDGKFYVSLVWPVETETLPATFEETAEDVKAQATNPSTYDAYLQEIKTTLNDLPPSAWQPDLDKLDIMIASLVIK
ncbi:MAG: META domain-containing protein [Anaerolineales bacterium]|nr:META domain-containing protein [Anaerolineales bacterium]